LGFSVEELELPACRIDHNHSWRRRRRRRRGGIFIGDV
jgi:hypothetical protein